MDQIKAILRNFHHSQSIKATARQLKVSKNTVRDYLRRALEHSNDVLKLLELEDSELENLFLKEPLDKQSVRLADFEKQTGVDQRTKKSRRNPVFVMGNIPCFKSRRIWIQPVLRTFKVLCGPQGLDPSPGTFAR